HHLLEGTERGEDEFSVSMAPTDLRFNASVSVQEDGRFLVQLSLGAFLAIDDAASIATRLMFRNDSGAWDHVQAQYLIEPKLLNYGFLSSIPTPGDARNFHYCYPFVPEDELRFEYQIQLANFALLWVLLHEIGHVQLGHLEPDTSDRSLGVLDERA